MDEGGAIQLAGQQLFALVDTDGRRKIIVDFSAVEYMTSLMLNKLITLEQKVKIVQGVLKLCSIRADIYRVFEITSYNSYFTIKENQAGALEGF